MSIKTISLKNILTAFLLGLLPIGVCLLHLHYFGFTAFDFRPAYNDEWHYWNEVNNFRSSFFQGGYSVINENVANARFSPFGAHGPGFAILLYPFAHLFGWKPYSPLILNALFLSIALFIYCMAEKRLQRKFYASAFVSTCFPVLLFIPTGMQETVQQSFAILSAVFVHYIISIQTKATRNKKILAMILISAFFSIAVITRASWGIVFFLIFICNGFFSRSLYINIFLAGTTFVLALLAIQYLYSPVPGLSQMQLLWNALGDPFGDSLRLFSIKTFENLVNFFIINEELPAFFLRIQFLSLLIYCLYLYFIYAKAPERPKDLLIVAAALSCLIGHLIIVLLFYQVGLWRDFRILATGFIFSALILGYLSIFNKVLWVLIFTQTIALMWFSPYFKEFRTDNFQPIVDSRNSISNAIAFTTDQNKWCNTLLLLPGNFDSDLIFHLPPGIGVSAVHGALPASIQSRYILAPDLDSNLLLSNSDIINTLQHVRQLDGGAMLYENLQTQC